MKALKAVFIDWHGTLSTSRFWEQLQPKHQLGHFSPKIQKALFNQKSPLGYLLTPWMRGQFVTEQVIDLLAKEIVLDPEVLLREFIISCKNMQFVSDRIPLLVKSMRSKGMKVVIATDNMDSFSRWTVPALGLEKIFDDILNSHNLQSMKQDIDHKGRSIFFHDYLEKHQLLPGQSIVIDDSPLSNEIIQRIGIFYQVPFGEGLVKKLEEIESEI